MMKMLFFVFLLLIIPLKDNRKPLVVISYSDNTIDIITKQELDTLYNKSYYGGAKYGSKREFLKTLIDFRLKLHDAISNGVEKDSTFLHEVSAYKEKILRQYVLDQNILDPLESQFYERMKKERHLQHLLVKVSKKNVKAEEEAYEKCLTIKREIEQGLLFEDAVVRYSDDAKTKKNDGDLGFITVGDVVLEMEDATYNSPKFSVKGPIRTAFGYHLIRVINEQESDISKYAHILIKLDPKPSYIDSVDAYYRIQEIEKKIRQGIPFDSVARDYSEDHKTASIGGDIGWFSKGRVLFPSLDRAMNSLKKIGDFSSVVRTNLGLHLIQLVKKGMPSFDEVRDHIKRRILDDSRRLLIAKKRFVSRQTERMNLVLDKNRLKILINQINQQGQIEDTISNAGRKLNVLGAIGGDSILVKDFLSYINKHSKVYGSRQGLEQILVDGFIEEIVFQRAMSAAEFYAPEIRLLLEHFKTSSLVFLQTEKKVWNKNMPSEKEARSFYEKNASRYLKRERIHVSALEFRRKDEAQDIFDELTKKVRTRGIISRDQALALRKPMDDSLNMIVGRGPEFTEIKKRLYKKLLEIKIDNKPRSFDSLMSIYPPRQGSWLALHDRFFEKGENAFVDMLINKEDGEVLGPFYYKKHFYIFRRNSIDNVVRGLTYQEARSSVISEYQEQKADLLMKVWIEGLRRNVSIKIREDDI